MDIETFTKIADETHNHCSEVLALKGKKYGSSDDRLSQFKDSGIELDCSPEKALQSMSVKHHLAVNRFISDINSGKTDSYITPDLLDEHIDDQINYLILLKALILERMEIV